MRQLAEIIAGELLTLMAKRGERRVNGGLADPGWPRPRLESHIHRETIEPRRRRAAP
jgi:hypothetical protein